MHGWPSGTIRPRRGTLRRVLGAVAAALIAVSISGDCLKAWPPENGWLVEKWHQWCQAPISLLQTTVKYSPLDLSQRPTSIDITACYSSARDKILPVFISVTNEGAPLTVRADQVFEVPEGGVRMLTIPAQEAARIAAGGWVAFGYALTAVGNFNTIFGGLLVGTIGALGVLWYRKQNWTLLAPAIGAIIGIIGGLIFSAVRIYVVEESDERGQANQEFMNLALKDQSTLSKGFTEHGYVYFVDPTKEKIKRVELLLTNATSNASLAGGEVVTKQEKPRVYDCQVNAPACSDGRPSPPGVCRQVEAQG
jgi:hypothetical protein